MTKTHLPIKGILAVMLAALIVVWGIRTQNMKASQNEMRSDVSYPSPGDAENPDAEIYAQNFGISLEEALRQFRLQDAAGELQVKLRENEADTFAGLWIEHDPEFKIVVLFTKDAKRKIKPYLTDELADVVEARDVKTSLAMLEKTQQQIISSLRGLEIQAVSETDVYQNNITIYINPFDRIKLDSALRDERIEIPNNVSIVTVWKLGQSGGITLTPSLGDHFPQLTEPLNAYPALPPLEGKLTLENGCLRVSGVNDIPAGDSFLIIWDPRFSTITEQGIVRVIDSLTGNVLVSAGDHVEVGYGGNVMRRTWKPIPSECQKPYFVIGESIKRIDRP